MIEKVKTFAVIDLPLKGVSDEQNEERKWQTKRKALVVQLLEVYSLPEKMKTKSFSLWIFWLFIAIDASTTPKPQFP